MRTKVKEIDVTELVADEPYWIITRWFRDPENICEAEWEEAAKSGITDFFSNVAGLCYNSCWDAMTVVDNMSRRFGQPFGVIAVGAKGVKMRIVYVSAA